MLPLAWMLISLSILIYTLWDAPKWYATKQRTWLIAAILYAPIHYAAAEWSTPAESLLFIAANTALSFALYWAAHAWTNPVAQPVAATQSTTTDPQIAAAYEALGIPQSKPQPPQPVPAYQSPIVEIEPFTDDEWEIVTPEGA